jgi:hypothetical protein
LTRKRNCYLQPLNDKHQARPEDLQRASVLFYSVNQLGFALVDLDVNAIIEKSVEYLF